MKNGISTRGSRILVGAITLMISASATFAGTLIPLSPGGDGSNIQPVPPVSGGGGGGNNILTARTWNSLGTDWNTDANWTGLAPVASGAVGEFTTVESVQPNLSTSVSIAGIYFQGTGSSGYDVTSSSSAVIFTLLGTDSTGLNGTSNSTAAAVRSEITSGTNTIDAPIILGAAAATTQVLFQSAGGTLIVNGAISNTNAITLDLKGAGTIQLNGSNTSLSAAVRLNQAGTTVVIGNDNALGTGTFTVNSTGTLQAGGGARTLANNVVLAGDTTLSGANGFTFNGTLTSSGSSTRTLTVSNTNGAIFNGTVSLEEAGAPAGRFFTINGTSAVTINGVIQNGSAQAAGLKYTGSSTLTLNNTNTYSGETQMTIAGSTIVVGASGTLGTGSVRLTAGTVTLTLSGPTQIASTATLFYVNTDIINLNYAGTDTIAGLTVDGVAQAAGVYGAGFINPDGVFAGTGSITVVPEPTTVAMMVLGGSLLVGMQRFRRKLR